MLKFLLTVDGYEIIESYSSDRLKSLDTLAHPYRYSSNVHVHALERLCKGHRKIDLVVSKSSSSLLPILHFHSTAVMNALLPFSFWSLYAGLTKR